MSLSDEELNVPHECDCCEWSGLLGELDVNGLDFYCCPACGSACVSEVNLT